MLMRSLARWRGCRPLLALAACVLVDGSSAQESQPARRPKIGLVLSGGGARGAAHVGVLKVMEELKIPVDLIVGNSMGALVAGIYAHGYSPAEMEKILGEIRWPLLLSDRSQRQDRSFRRKQDDLNYQVDATVGFRDFSFVLPKGLVVGHYVGNLLKVLVMEPQQVTDFDQLRIPYRAVATDIVNGEQVVLSSGELAQAMAASMAIPGAFAPVVIGGRQLVDGMVVNNVPIDVAKQLGAEVVIAVDIGTPLLEAEQIRSLLNVTGQMISILMQKNIDEQIAKLTPSDLLIRPDLGDITSTSFERAVEAIAIGEKKARELADQLRRFSVSDEEYRRFLARQRKPPTAYPVIDSVRLKNDSGLADAVILALIETKPGEVLDPARLQRDFDRIYGLEEFERVSFELQPTAPGHADLTLVATAKSWGPNYLNFALNLEDDFRGDATYSLGARYTMRALNSLGAEWRNEVLVGEPIRLFSEFYQPLDTGGRLFVAPRVLYHMEEVNVFSGGVKLGEFDTSVGGGGLDVGTHFGNWAELRVGVERYWGTVRPDVTTVPIERFNFDDGFVRARLVVDTLDNTHFPNAGVLAGADWSFADDGLGGDIDYQRLEVLASYVFTFDKNTLLTAVDFGTALDGTLPVHRLLQRGGFLNFSGFTRNELTGQHAALARLVGYRRIAGTPLAPFGMPVYLGGSFELGNVVQDRDDLFKDPIAAGSAFLGVDAPVGPIYLGYGLSEGGQDSFYFFIGRTF